MSKNWVEYENGNYTVHINLENGTKVRQTDEDEFKPKRAESCDVKITNQCDMGCSFCHERSVSDGMHSSLEDLMNFADKVPAYMELAIGGGNPLSHPHLIPFLKRLKERKAIPSMTVHQKHFQENILLLEHLCKEKLIYGLGISLANPHDEFIEAVKKFPNAVIHVINGCTWPSHIERLKDKGLKILVLGYKMFGRGVHSYEKNKDVYLKRFLEWDTMMSKMIKEGWFNTISFDNLALTQLNVKQYMSEEEWSEFFMGDDGQFTFFIDLVERTFCTSSTTAKNDRYVMGYDLSLEEMFEIIRMRNGNQ